MGCSGENPATCATGDGGQPYSLTIYLRPPKEPRRGLRLRHFAGQLGLVPARTVHLGRGHHAAGRRRRREATTSISRSWTTRRRAAARRRSDDRFIIAINPGRRAADRRPRASLPDANINQAYTRAGAHRADGDRQLVDARERGASARAHARIERRHLGHADRRAACSLHRAGERCRTHDTKQLSIFVLAPLELQTLARLKPPAGKLTAKTVVNAPLATGLKAEADAGRTRSRPTAPSRPASPSTPRPERLPGPGRRPGGTRATSP